MTFETESEANPEVIQAVLRKKIEIISILDESSSSKNFQQIKDWVTKVTEESLSEDISLVSIIIDTIYSLVKNKIHEKNDLLIEHFFSEIININKFSDLSSEKKFLIYRFKEYVYNQMSDKELEKFKIESKINAKKESFLGRIKNQNLSNIKYALDLFLSSNNLLGRKIQQEISQIFPHKSRDIPTSELVVDEQLSDNNADSIPQFANITSEGKNKQLRKKNKVRVIDFDEDGNGYDINSPYLFLKKFKRLSEINFEIELSPKKIFEEELIRLGKIYPDEESLLKGLHKQIAEKEFQLFASEKERNTKFEVEKNKRLNIEKSIKKTKKNRENLRKKQRNISKSKKIAKLLDPIVFIIQERIDRCKKGLSNENSFDLKLPVFEDSKDFFFVGFLASINYNEFKLLINYAKSVSIAIDQIKITLNKINDFTKSLDSSFNCIDIKINSLNDVQIKLKATFSNASVINFLDLSLNLYQKCTLNLENNYCLLNIKEKIGKVEFSEPEFLSAFISDNKPEKIIESLADNISQFFNQERIFSSLIKNSKFENKNEIASKIFNFFSKKHYLLSHKYKLKFVEKFLSNFRKSPDFESIQTEVSRLKWWHFFLLGINPFYAIKKDLKMILVKDLFLYLIEEEFKKVDKKPSLKNIDAMYSIQDRLMSSNFNDKSQSIPLTLMHVSKSRQKILDRFMSYEKTNELLNEVTNLYSNAIWCGNQFSDLLKTCQREDQKYSSSFVSANRIFFKGNTTRGPYFPISSTKDHFSSYVSRGIS